ncbi:MAG: alpha/beta hydrolase [Mesorhizobium sp.]
MQKDPFRTRDHVGDFDSIVADFVQQSAQVRADIPMVADVPYGPDATETMDIFFPKGARIGLPVHMFIHGGYWRMFSKRDYSYIAETVTRTGAIAVIVDYALMPSVRMATIVEQMRRAKHWVLNHIADHGGDPNRVTISGHSAGAHLAALLFDETDPSSGIKSALLLGGLYDLKPLQRSFLASQIAITDEEVALFSPLTHRFDPKVIVDIAFGADETPPFHSQANALAKLLREQGSSVSLTNLSGANHMSSVRDLGMAGTQAAQLLEKTILNS